MARLRDKVALVTGAASVPGLGSATATRFAEEGAVVYLSDVDLEGAEAVAAQIRQAGGGATALRHDVTLQPDWDRVIGTIIAAQGRLDVLVNNAGIAVLRMIDELTHADWMRQLDVNLSSVFYGTQRAVREMRRAGQGGSIINLSSIAGQVGVQTGLRGLFRQQGRSTGVHKVRGAGGSSGPDPHQYDSPWHDPHQHAESRAAAQPRAVRHHLRGNSHGVHGRSSGHCELCIVPGQ